MLTIDGLLRINCLWGAPVSQNLIGLLESPDFWLNRLPDFHINNSVFLQPCDYIHADQRALVESRDNLVEEGYFKLDSVIPAGLTNKLARGIASLHQIGILPVFAMVYDEYWEAFKKLSMILGTILDDDFMVLPDFWVWHVDRNQDSAGFAEHRDVFVNNTGKDGLPNLMSIWVPFTDASPENSCIYLLPSSLDEHHPDDLETIKYNSQDIRAVPLKAGSVMGWDSTLVHWGGRSSKHARVPRINYAFYVQRPHKNQIYNLSINFSDMLPFHGRLKLIATQLINFGQRYNYTGFVRQFAEKHGDRSLLG